MNDAAFNLSFLGYILQMIGILSGSSFILQRLFTVSFFTVFIKLVPIAITSIYPKDSGLKPMAMEITEENVYTKWL